MAAIADLAQTDECVRRYVSYFRVTSFSTNSE